MEAPLKYNIIIYTFIHENAFDILFVSHLHVSAGIRSVFHW